MIVINVLYDRLIILNFTIHKHLCDGFVIVLQIGLDGIRLLEPATSRTLKIYTLDNVARWEVN